ncbi:hypothetical protein ACFS5M_09655 [Lacinutrix iliipiscaria]|uniref:Lipoprotein n=1 Tax=Lacinutrix iliipiscaria TaxID=1230532 RepID=A0ABW5WNX4_9FLAO
MKSKKILFLTFITLFISCSKEGAEAFLEATERPCYDIINEEINDRHEEANYQASLFQRPDGSWETIEDCMAILDIYRGYLEFIETHQEYFDQHRDSFECSEYDLNSIENLYTARIRAANQTIDSYSLSCG